MGVVIGVIGGYGAVGFRIAIHAIELSAFGIVEPSYEFLLELPWYWRLAIPVKIGRAHV